MMLHPVPLAVRAAAIGAIFAPPLLSQSTPGPGPSRVHVERMASIPASTVQPTSIRDIAVTPRGTSFLLDPRGGMLYAFSKSGDLRAALKLAAAPGAAPLFGFLIAPFGEDGVLMYDAASFRVHAYQWHSPATLTEVARISVDAATAEDLCAIGDTVFLLAAGGGHMIHPYALHGGGGTPFGAPPGSNRFVRQARITAGGYLACFSTAKVVVAGLAASGVVQAYRSDGTPLWQFTIPHFSGLSFRTMRDSTVQMSWGGAARDAVVSTLSVADDHVAVQVNRFVGLKQHLETTVLDLKNGQSLSVQQDIPMMRRAAGTWMISVVDGPPSHADIYAIVPPEPDH